MLKGTNEVLGERGTTHGPFELQGDIAVKLNQELKHTPYYPSFTRPVHHALDMICMKLSRIVAGDPHFSDHWVDISGYAALAIYAMEDKAMSEVLVSEDTDSNKARTVMLGRRIMDQGMLVNASDVLQYRAHKIFEHLVKLVFTGDLEHLGRVQVHADAAFNMCISPIEKGVGFAPKSNVAKPGPVAERQYKYEE